MPVYTRPEKVWAVNELANAAALNTYQRDNMGSTFHRVAYKTADETVTNSTTLQNDDHLFVDIKGNERWYFRLMLICAQPSPVSVTSYIKVQFEGLNSLGATTGGFSFCSWGVTPSGLGFSEWALGFGAVGLGATTTANRKTVHIIDGIVQTFSGAAMVPFRVQWAQNVADAGGVTVYKGSTLFGLNNT